MQEIDLQISNTVSVTFDSDNLLNNPITLDVTVSNNELKQARDNGGKVIWATSTLENKIEGIVTNYLFGVGYGINHKREFFSNEIIKTKHVSYDAKKHLIKQIAIKGLVLDKEERKELTRLLNKIMKYRNAFAHGKLLYDHDSGCILKFYSGGHDSFKLNGKFWDQLELDFKTANEILDKMQRKIDAPCIEEFKGKMSIPIKETKPIASPKQNTVIKNKSE